MVAKIRQRQSAAESPNPTKPVVGEIDTSPPIQSVKDAVSLFGESAFSGENAAIKKTKSYSVENVWAKETQLHLAQKEMKKLKENLKSAETTKTQVLGELEKAKRTVVDLAQKLEVLSESRDLAIQATEDSKSQAKQLKEEKCGNLDGTNGALKEELETTVISYKTVIKELDAAKQELRKIRQGCKESMEARVSAIKQAAEAKGAMEANTERASEISKEILAVQESIEQMKVASDQELQQQAEILVEKDILSHSHKPTLEESEKKLLSLKKELGPELTKNLEVQLSETMNEIGTLQKEIENKKTSALDSAESVTLELDGAKESLQKVSDEENTLRSLVDALRVDLENVKREHSELLEKERETESVLRNLQVKLWESESELEAHLTEESKGSGASEEMILNQLSSETENARREAEDMKFKAMELKMEAAVAKLALEDAEIKLKLALEEADAAKAAETSILDQIRVLSERTSAVRASTSEYDARITISREEFESLTRKIEESDKLADIKVVAATAQVEALKARENEALKKLEATRKEVEDTKSATQEALKKAAMAEAAKRAVESELRKWREREQKKAAEAASQILAETQMSSSNSSPQHYRIQKQNSAPKNMEARKLEKGKVSVSKKVLLPSISSIFHRKKNQVEGGSPSYLPGENPL